MAPPTQVLEGYARVLVLAVGTNSQQGKISTLLMERGGSTLPKPQDVAGAAAPAFAAPAPAPAPPPSPASATVLASAPPPAARGKGVQREDSLGGSSFLTRKLDQLARQIGLAGMTAAAAVLLYNWGSYTLQV